jgi:hypothetical protein
MRPQEGATAAWKQRSCQTHTSHHFLHACCRGCSAALDDDKLLGENMCSYEAEDLLRITALEDAQFPMR